MNTTTLETNFEPRWKTYLRAIVFVLPPVILYFMSLISVVPKLKELFLLAKVDMAEVGWGWHIPLFLGDNRHVIFVMIVLAVILLELLSKRMWPRCRRIMVDTATWVLNVYVLLSFGCLLILAVMSAQNLANPR
jgi:hypothetical protein